MLFLLFGMLMVFLSWWDITAFPRVFSTAVLFFFLRPLMTKLVNVDIFASGLDSETDIQHPANTPFMLAFINIAANGSLLAEDDGAVLKNALTFLSNNLNERGTIVMALPDWEFPRTKLKGDISVLCKSMYYTETI